MRPLRGICAVLFFLTSMPAWALPEIKSERPADGAFLGEVQAPSDEVEVLAPKDILLLDDQKITDAYIDTLVEIDAVKVAHSSSSFLPKEFKRYKRLLKYRMQLLLEIHRRKIDIPAEIK